MYSFPSNTVDQMVNTIKTDGRGNQCPAVIDIYLCCATMNKEEVTSPIRKAYSVPNLTKTPTSSSLTVMPPKPSLICGSFFFTRGAFLSLDSLGTGRLRLLGTFFWGSQALSSLSSSSEADDLGVKLTEKFPGKMNPNVKGKKETYAP